MDFKINIKEAFDQISEIYDRVRRQPWKDLIDFIDDYNFLNECDVSLDIGCGNGRHTNILAGKCNLSIGIELSNELLKIAEESRKHSNIYFINCDAVHLPFRNDMFSNIIFIATLHHISTTQQRIESLKELKRVLNPSGKAIITVWRRFQERFFLIFLIDFFFLTFQKKWLEFGDIFVPWHGPNKKIMVNRFYHLFTITEFKTILKKADMNILECKYFSGKTKNENIIALIKRKK